MYQIAVQRAVSNITIPSTPRLKRWAKATLQQKIPEAELTIRIVEKDEIIALNTAYRKKHKPTNVLSFPSELPVEIELEKPMLGDIVLCAEVIIEEALDQNKAEEAHWAHMIVHGILHLLGYDHENDHDAEIMEAEEIKILEKLGFDNPYQIVEKKHGK